MPVHTEPSESQMLKGAGAQQNNEAFAEAGQPFGRRVRSREDALAEVRSVAYAIFRFLEIQCAWLPNLSSCQDKIALGKRIGSEGEALRIIVRRLIELEPTYQLRGTRWIEAFALDSIDLTVDADRMSRAERLIGVEREVIDTARNKILASHLALLDEPSVTALDAAEAMLPSTAMGAIPAHQCAEVSEYTGREPLSELPANPVREDRLYFRVEPLPSMRDQAATLEGRRQLLHDLFIDIEIAAAEVCAANVVLFRAAPVQFKLDMFRQIWDECRHAEAALARYIELGGELISQPYTLNVWRRWKAFPTLPEKLAAQQVIQEGNALDSGRSLAEVMAAHGDQDTARMLEFFAADEEQHVLFGNRWLMASVLGDERKYMSTLAHVSKSIQATVPGRAPVDRVARRRAGFPPRFLEQIAPVNVGGISAEDQFPHARPPGA